MSSPGPHATTLLPVMHFDQDRATGVTRIKGPITGRGFHTFPPEKEFTLPVITSWHGATTPIEQTIQLLNPAGEAIAQQTDYLEPSHWGYILNIVPFQIWPSVSGIHTIELLVGNQVQLRRPVGFFSSESTARARLPHNPQLTAFVVCQSVSVTGNEEETELHEVVGKAGHSKTKPLGIFAEWSYATRSFTAYFQLLDPDGNQIGAQGSPIIVARRSTIAASVTINTTNFTFDQTGLYQLRVTYQQQTLAYPLLITD